MFHGRVAVTNITRTRHPCGYLKIINLEIL